MASLDDGIPWQDVLLELRGLRRDVREILSVLAEQAAPRENAPATEAADLPPMLTIVDVARLLRTTPKAVYAKVQRGQLPGVQRLGRRVLVRRDVLLRSLRSQAHERDLLR